MIFMENNYEKFNNSFKMIGNFIDFIALVPLMGILSIAFRLFA